jgi:hypothetical protein
MAACRSPPRELAASVVSAGRSAAEDACLATVCISQPPQATICSNCLLTLYWTGMELCQGAQPWCPLGSKANLRRPLNHPWKEAHACPRTREPRGWQSATADAVVACLTSSPLNNTLEQAPGSTWQLEHAGQSISGHF